jgi:hypothetical protein
VRRRTNARVQSRADHLQRVGLLRDRLATREKLEQRIVELLRRKATCGRKAVGGREAVCGRKAVFERLGGMIWIPVSGALAALVLILIATVVVLSAAIRTKRHADALVPAVLIAKFEKAQGDVGRIDGALILAEALLIRAQEAIERIRARFPRSG